MEWMSYTCQVAPLGGRRLTALAATFLLAVAVAVAVAGALAGPPKAGAATVPAVAIGVNASSITVSGALQSGAVNVVSTATGVKESGAVLVALKPGVSPERLLAFVGSNGGGELNNVSKFGSIMFDTEVGSGHPSEVQTFLAPGQYVALATQEQGPPRAHAVFSVSASNAPVALPAPRATVRSIDFAFRGPATLHVGELVRFENEGFLVHMDIAAPVRSRKAAKALVRAIRAGHEKQAFRLVSGAPTAFAGPLSAGAFQQEVITARPGWYVQLCFMDTEDGRSHTLLGMARVIKIAK
jgi:hypothetical protein